MLKDVKEVLGVECMNCDDSDFLIINTKEDNNIGKCKLIDISNYDGNNILNSTRENLFYLGRAGIFMFKCNYKLKKDDFFEGMVNLEFVSKDSNITTVVTGDVKLIIK